jgi:hypothetical protein
MPNMNSNHGEVTDDRRLSGINVSARIAAHVAQRRNLQPCRAAFDGIFDRGKR